MSQIEEFTGYATPEKHLKISRSPLAEATSNVFKDSVEVPEVLRCVSNRVEAPGGASQVLSRSHSQVQDNNRSVVSAKGSESLVQMAQEVAIHAKYNLPRMQSVERISKLPAVEQTVDLANNLYVRVKDTNNLVKTVLTTAETTVKGAVDITLPVTAKLERPIKVMDSFLCSSLDYVENKIPAVKLPLDQVYKNTRDSLYTIPGVRCACQAGEQGVKKAVEIAYGATLYGTQKVRDYLSLSSSNLEDLRRVLPVQYSESAKRFFLLLLSWLWMTKPHATNTSSSSTSSSSSSSSSTSTTGENSVGVTKETETNAGPMSREPNSGATTGEEKENHLPNHTKSD